jgi:hypothetical protein
LEKKIGLFIEQKQKQNNETNKREFLMDNTEGCARTESNQISKQTHVIKTKMWNETGPLDKSNQENLSKNRALKKNIVLTIDDGLDERMKNIEAYLDIPTSKQIPADVYERVKLMENSILEWEKNHQLIQMYQLSFPPKKIKKQSQSKKKMPEKQSQNNPPKKLNKKPISSEKVSTPQLKPPSNNTPRTNSTKRKRNSLQFRDDHN